jgi:hypothetical protein
MDGKQTARVSMVIHAATWTSRGADPRGYREIYEADSGNYGHAGLQLQR